MADDLLTAILLARSGPVLAAPAMNDAMYAHPATQANLATLTARGWRFIGPDDRARWPRARASARARMSEPEAILQPCCAPARRRLALGGAQGRRERRSHPRAPRSGPRDHQPVERTHGVRALAEAARDRGAQVVLVAGPTTLAPPVGVELVPVETTEQMQRALQQALTGASALFMAAAPADYRAVKIASRKRPRVRGRFTCSVRADPGYPGDVAASGGMS